jgi:hypothetical protein
LIVGHENKSEVVGDLPSWKPRWNPKKGLDTTSVTSPINSSHCWVSCEFPMNGAMILSSLPILYQTHRLPYIVIN